MTKSSGAFAAMSVSEFAKWAGIGRTTAWKEVNQGRLPAIKVSARTLIRIEDAVRWLETRPKWTPSADGSVYSIEL